MAKLVATESAQRVIDEAVQLHGARGVARGECVERLYREIRALRIYEGATEVQKLDHRPRAAASAAAAAGRRMNASTAHVDTFARDNLPPRDAWPELLFELPELQYPERMNCGVGAARPRRRARLGRPDGDRRAGRLALDLCGAAGATPTASRTCWSRTCGSSRAIACCCAAPTRRRWRRAGSP